MTATPLLTGDQLHAVIARLFPVMRSITGPGVRQSLAELQQIAPITVHEVPSGTAVFDWVVPDEWHFNEAWLADADGNYVVDACNHNLHIINYSSPVRGQFTREQLLPHLHCLPDQPDSIPYRTSYYADQWGFCLTQRTLDALGDGPFTVKIDAQKTPGVLNYGELFIPGKSSQQMLVSTHICHPQLANDNLSGMVLAAALAAWLLQEQPELSWRFVFVPGTIGAITWLSENRNNLQDIAGGLVITGLGDASAFNWKQSVNGGLWIDRLMAQVLAEAAPLKDGKPAHHILPFSPYGYDERQYCSPGFNLPVGRLSRAVHGTFRQYHTSEDNLKFVEPARLAESLTLLQHVARAADQDRIYNNLAPFGEPQLGKRGIYGSLGAQVDPGRMQMCLLWMLNQSDSTRSVSDIAHRSGISMDELHQAARLLVQHNLLEEKGHACINEIQTST